MRSRERVQNVRAIGGQKTLVSLDEITLHLVDMIFDDLRTNLHVRPSLTAIVRRALRAYASKLNSLTVDGEDWLEEKMMLSMAASGENEEV